MPVTAHYFDSTQEAYDASQTHEEIHDGDVLVVPSCASVAVLIEAWPVAVTPAVGEFHKPAEDFPWSAVKMVGTRWTRDYSESLKVAREHAAKFDETGDTSAG